MSKIFIDRPIFAWVIAIIIMLMGIGAILKLPVAQYPDVAPTQINIRASYPGASAATLESSVTQILEQQLTGIDGMLYFQSSSTARGSVSISVILEKGIDPDIAQVQVQNSIQAAISRLPQQVQQQGVRVTKGSPDLLDYSSTKGAILGFTRSLAKNLVKKGIRVNGVAPGPIWTPLNPSGGQPKEDLPEFGKDTPMGRPGQPNEVAPCFLFLACEDSSYMTGQILHPDGGSTTSS